MQAGILAVAGIIVRIIGLLYNTPLTNIIGDEGFGYYSNAYTAYSIVLLISSYSIPSAALFFLLILYGRCCSIHSPRRFLCRVLHAGFLFPPNPPIHEMTVSDHFPDHNMPAHRHHKRPPFHRSHSSRSGCEDRHCRCHRSGLPAPAKLLHYFEEVLPSPAPYARKRYCYTLSLRRNKGTFHDGAGCGVLFQRLTTSAIKNEQEE